MTANVAKVAKEGTSFVQSGKIFQFHDNSANQIHDELPVGNYIVQKDPRTGGLFLEKVAPFPKLGKLYGNISKQTNRILNTFLDRPSGTGVVLAGEKGSGKTMLAKNVSMEAAKLYGYPTLIVNQPLAGDGFNKFIQTINQPMIVLFDEFEKVYNNEEQELLLTLLDGSFPSKKLFILTSNDKWRINDHMRNRPGRIFYMVDFEGLEPAFVREYCEDNLHDKTKIDQVVKTSGFFSKFNFDMLQAIVEEMNRYGESPQDAMKMLNARMEYSGKQTYTMTTLYKGHPVGKTEDEQRANGSLRDWTGNPILDKIESYCVDPSSKDPEDPDYIHYHFSPEDIKGIDPQNETTTYQRGDIQVILKRKWAKTYSVWDSGVF